MALGHCERGASVDVARTWHHASSFAQAQEQRGDERENFALEPNSKSSARRSHGGGTIPFPLRGAAPIVTGRAKLSRSGRFATWRTLAVPVSPALKARRSAGPALPSASMWRWGLRQPPPDSRLVRWRDRRVTRMHDMSRSSPSACAAPQFAGAQAVRIAAIVPSIGARKLLRICRLGRVNLAKWRSTWQESHQCTSRKSHHPSDCSV